MNNKAKESDELESRKARMEATIAILKKEYPDAKIELEYKNPLDLLVATILSAQCTDARVNIVTRELFKVFKTVDDYINSPNELLEQYIFSAGFYKMKAKNIKNACKMIKENYNGELPNTMEELLRLPGVGRKTANVILGHCFNTAGIVVDTHVLRVCKRMGFTLEENPTKVEFDLMKVISDDYWVLFTHLIIRHGRKTCSSRSPKCSLCAVKEECEFKQKCNKK